MSERDQDSTAGAAVIMTCGLPASGKTTTAARLHTHLGGVLIRSCDVYKELGIVLSEWVSRTQQFTTKVSEYDRLRDEAYAEMARRVTTCLASGSRVVIVDAVHGELDKRRTLYDISCARGAAPVVVLYLCDDFEEVRRRLWRRRGRENEPEHEASDLSVFHDIRRRWQSPLTDELPDGRRPTILTYDTLRGRETAIHVGAPAAAQRVRAALVTPFRAVSRRSGTAGSRT